jgi:micrococcal nuclease
MSRKDTRRLATALLTLAWLIAAYAVAPKAQTVESAVPVTTRLGISTSTTTPSRQLGKSDFPTMYPVVHVVDGDTIDIEAAATDGRSSDPSLGEGFRKDGAKVRVRLIGINAPESVDPRRPVQCFGKEASAEMSRIVGGQSVRLETDPSQDTYDRYGRLLAYAFLPDGTDVNLHMIEAGFAYEYTYHLSYRYQKEFKAAQAAAEKRGSGLWAAGVCGH